MTADSQICYDNWKWDSAGSSEMERLLASGIESAYGRKEVLCGVELSAEAGQCIGIVGANGCGKSTLLHILAGLKRADRGQVFFDGTKATEKLFVRYTGYVPQECSLIEELSVQDNLLLWYDGRDALKQALQGGLLHMLGVEAFCGMRVGRLSGGMKKKVSIGCALAGNPPILLLDEPGAALDLPGKMEVKNYLLQYKEAGGTVILATHEESELDICDKIYALYKGKSSEIDSSLRGEALMRFIQGNAQK